MSREERKPKNTRGLKVQSFEPKGTDIAIAVSFEEHDVVLTVSKAGFAIHRLILEDMQKDLSVSDLAELAAAPSEDFFNPETHLRVIRRVRREFGRR